MEVVKLSDRDGSWQALKDDWKAQCEACSEDFDSYAVAAFSVLDPLAASDETSAGVFAIKRDGIHHAICQANCTGLPGYDGPVLRIRFMLFAPDYDFGEKDLDDYGMLLADLFLGVIELSEDVLQARYVKIHLRSPADRQFFTILGRGLEQSDHFDSVHVKGAWLYVTKSQ